MSDNVVPLQPPREPRAGDWRTQEMFLIQQVMSLIGRGLEIDGVVREILHLLSELLGLNRGRVVLHDADRDVFAVRYAYGLTRKEIARGRFRAGEGVTGRAIADGHLIILQDIDSDGGFLFRTVARCDLPEGTVAFLAMPIVLEGRTVGAIACHRIRGRERALSDDVSILRMCATIIGQLLTLHARVESRTKELERRNEMLASALRTSRARYGIIGTSSLLLAAIAQIEKVSSSNASVLLLGATGTGKELMARALHLDSRRKDKPFIKVNCAAIPETLFESELFGHEKGAFTGAIATRAGLFEQARGGTLFLDEIGEMPLVMQTKLLRTLQEGRVVRVGGSREIAVDARVVAATHRDLKADVARGAFREDLFYRLNVIPIVLPSLAERRGDIPDLALHFLEKVNRDNGLKVSLTSAAVDLLARQRWPGNIRQLGNVVERMTLLATSSIVEVEDVEAALDAMPAPDEALAPATPIRATSSGAGCRKGPSLLQRHIALRRTPARGHARSRWQQISRGSQARHERTAVLVSLAQAFRSREVTPSTVGHCRQSLTNCRLGRGG